MLRSIFQLRYLLWVLLLAVGGCISPSPMAQTPPPPTAVPATKAETTAFPDVLAGQLTRKSDGSFDITLTISSLYDTPQQYADGWRVLAPDGTVLGEHTLLHDHANEQPFTRTQPNVIIPSDLLTVTIEARDLVNGYGGQTLTIPVE